VGRHDITPVVSFKTPTQRELGVTPAGALRESEAGDAKVDVAGALIVSAGEAKLALWGVFVMVFIVVIELVIVLEVPLTFTKLNGPEAGCTELVVTAKFPRLFDSEVL